MENAKANRGRQSVEEFTLNDWQNYAAHIGHSIHSVNDLFDLEEDFEDESGTGGGIDISGGATETDISLNFVENRNEGNIVYDSSQNIFLEASRSKNDNNPEDNGELNFRPLGYSFFRENLEGQPPSPLFFFLT